MPDISELRNKLFGPPESRHRRLNMEGTKKAILALVQDGMSVGRAANKLGLSRADLRNLTLQEPEFLQQLDDAYNLGTDYLEDLALERAHESDSVLIKLLESRRPEKFSSRRIISHSPVEIRKLTDVSNQAPSPMGPSPVSDASVDGVRSGDTEVLPRLASPSGEG